MSGGRSAKGAFFHRVEPIASGELGLFHRVTLAERDRLEAVASWGELPELVLDGFLAKLIETTVEGACDRVSMQALFSAAAVCRWWRESAMRAIGNRLWKSDNLLSHPAQLMALCPVPDTHMKCCLVREAISSCFFGKRYKYSLYLENPGTGTQGKFLMSAVQQSWQSLSIYFSSKERSASCGTLVSNAWGYHYRLYKTDAANFNGVEPYVQIPCFHKRIASVTYRINLRNLTRFSGTRRWDLFMDVKLPTTNPRKPIVTLVNNPPKWNQGLRCFSLDFRGRVKLASVKNFQLMKEHSAAGKEEIVLQFGKVAPQKFILDFDPTLLSTFQAFAVALASFEAT